MGRSVDARESLPFMKEILRSPGIATIAAYEPDDGTANYAS